MQEGMNEFLEWQNESVIRYTRFCELRKLNSDKDAIDYAHEKYHWAKLKMQEIKDKFNLVFAN